MIKDITKIIVASIIGGLIVIGGILLKGNDYNFSGITHLSGLATSDDGLTVGNTGTVVSKIIAPANCTIIDGTNTITASTTKQVDCAVSGLVSGDTVYAVATTSISSTFEGILIKTATASSTSGYATLTLFNATGTTFTWTATASTSIKVFGIR